MGSWNETCFVSHLPIFSGEECYAVLMVENSLRQSPCYPCAKCVPFALVKGEYNDYGSLENICRFDEFRQILALLTNVVERTDDGNYIPYDLGKIRNFSDLMELVRHKGLYLEVKKAIQIYTHKMYVELNIVFVKTGCLDLPVSCWNGGIDERISGLLADVKAAIEQPFNKGDAISEVGYEMNISEAVREVCDWISCQTPNAANWSFMTAAWIQHPDLAEFMYQRLMRLTSVLSALRMSYHIPSGSGSQEEVTETHLALADFCKQEYQRREDFLAET